MVREEERMRGERVALCKSVERDEFASTRADFALKLIHVIMIMIQYT